ncbi:hypothetical protein NDU88_005274 [Pleurodeles waltl]|uniref:Uncharacterized protein n=1 Tax=Pleurodeles waltl TaxID=8319 RepID=A0AAV7L0B6_PLEWA|nr:hypothetical protein NDU88_005274 [Pleurodeles waltl]
MKGKYDEDYVQRSLVDTENTNAMSEVGVLLEHAACVLGTQTHQPLRGQLGSNHFQKAKIRSPWLSAASGPDDLTATKTPQTPVAGNDWAGHVTREQRDGYFTASNWARKKEK